MTTATRILIVDDEPPIRKFLRIALEAHHYEVDEAATGATAIGRAATGQPSLVILDLGLPDMDGKQVVMRLREWTQVPILVLSVRQADAEKVAALDNGANDYVVKPFSMPELLARVRVLLRTIPGAASTGAPARLELGALVIDLASHEVFVDGAALRLTKKEFDLLAILGRHVGRLLTHAHLLREVWGPAHVEDTQYLRVFISQLRQKLGDDPARPRFILNEPGIGYRLLGG